MKFEKLIFFGHPTEQLSSRIEKSADLYLLISQEFGQIVGKINRLKSADYLRPFLTRYILMILNNGKAVETKEKTEKGQLGQTLPLIFVFQLTTLIETFIDF